MKNRFPFVLVGALLPWVALAQVYNFFPPPGMGYNASTSTVTILNNSAPTDQKKTALQVDSSGNFNIAAQSDAGVVSTTDRLQIARGTGNKFASIIFQDSTYSGNESFSIGGNSATYTAVANGGVLFTFQDPGSTAPFSALALQTASTDSFLFCTEGSGVGATLTNGLVGSHCDLGAGGNSFLGFSSPVQLEFGTQSLFAGAIDLNQNTVFDRNTANAVGDTNGHFFLPAVAGVPTGVPAASTGPFSFAKALRFNSAGNQLYAYNGAWKNVADFPTTLAAPTGSGCTVSAFTARSAAGGPLTHAAGSFTSGTTGTCTVTITLPAVGTTWVCRADDLNAPATVIGQSAASTTSCTITGATTSGDALNFIATGF